MSINLLPVAFICDGKRECGSSPDCMVTCFHTLDPAHAKNFEKVEDGVYGKYIERTGEHNGSEDS